MSWFIREKTTVNLYNKVLYVNINEFWGHELTVFKSLLVLILKYREVVLLLVSVGSSDIS